MVDNQFVKIQTWKFVYVSVGYTDSQLQVFTKSLLIMKCQKRNRVAQKMNIFTSLVEL